MDMVSSTIPRNVRRVVGPSTFSSLIGAPIAWQRDFIKLRISYDSRCPSLLGLPSKNHLSSAGNSKCHNCFAISNVLHLLAG